MQTDCDILVIGGGIVGLATAYALVRKEGTRVILIEAESVLGYHQTGHNSGVIHSGIYYRTGSLKARFCTAGRKAMIRFCEEHGIRTRPCGKLVVATSKSEIPRLIELKRRGLQNGLKGLEQLDIHGMKAIEPHVEGLAGLRVPETAVVDYGAVARTLGDLVVAARGAIHLKTTAVAVHSKGETARVETDRGIMTARYVINCGGLQADRIARMSGADPSVRIIPVRGRYQALRPEYSDLVRGLIYPVPDPRYPYLGIHFTRDLDGRVFIGPNAILAWHRNSYRNHAFSPKDTLDMIRYRGFRRMIRHEFKTGLGEWFRSISKQSFLRSAQRMLPELTSEMVSPAGCGIRAQAVDPDGKLVDDFLLVKTPRATHVLNAPSPAATASLVIGRHLAKTCLESFNGHPRDPGESPRF